LPVAAFSRGIAPKAFTLAIGPWTRARSVRGAGWWMSGSGGRWSAACGRGGFLLGPGMEFGVPPSGAGLFGLVLWGGAPGGTRWVAAGVGPIARAARCGTTNGRKT